ILESPQFTLLLGEAQEPVVVHAMAIATLSDPLNCLINGHMKEAQEKSAELPYIEKDDFLRLCEFAYRGDYTTPPFGGGSGDQNTDSDVLARLADRDRRPDCHPRYKIASTFVTRLSRHPGEDWTPVLLGHARMYCIADRYMIQALKDVTLFKLHHSLKGYSHDLADRSNDIIDVVHFAYSSHNTSDRIEYEDEDLDDLRELLVEYIASEAFQLEKVIEGLLDEGGQFAVDFWRVMKGEL
ncbi:hypothetical protein K505DRAFT_215438, partial [Melanomma pulvis-pyrius CBS 109.77]